MFKKTIFFLSFFLICLINNNSYANSQGYRDELPDLQRLTDLTIGIKRINKGLKYESKGKFKKANKMYKESIDFLLEANKNQNIDPNIFLYLGFAYNKLKNFDNAKIYYLLGLSLEPKNKYINKYLGQLYITQNKTNLAKERLEVLKDCNCKEYFVLKDLINKY